MSDKCTKCNTCTDNCPIIEVTGKENLYDVFFGNEENIWNCSSCFTCDEVCPENLSVRNQIFRIRRSLKFENLPRGIKKYFRNLVETGNVFEIDEEFINERRTTMSLGDIDFKKIKSELKKLMADYK